jgi:hypothetical protein
MVGFGEKAGEMAALAGVVSLFLPAGVLAQEQNDTAEFDAFYECWGEGLDWDLEPRLAGLVMENFGWGYRACPFVELHQWAIVDCDRELFLKMTVYRDGEEGTLAHRKPINVEPQMNALRSKLFAAGNDVEIVEIENTMRAAGARIELSQWSGVADWCDNDVSYGNRRW